MRSTVHKIRDENDNEDNQCQKGDRPRQQRGTKFCGVLRRGVGGTFRFCWTHTSHYQSQCANDSSVKRRPRPCLHRTGRGSNLPLEPVAWFTYHLWFAITKVTY